MIISFAGLFLLVIACLSVGCAGGMVIMALCRVSAECRDEVE